MALISYGLQYIADGRIMWLPYAGGLLDQPGDLMHLLGRIVAAIHTKR